MTKIVSTRHLAPNAIEYVISAPEIARHAQPGQFIILRVDEEGERVPFTISDYDRTAGTITLLIQTVGYTTELMSHLVAGDEIHDIVGPLGNATDLTAFDSILLIGGGIGSAVIYPQAKYLRALGKKVSCILGARNSELLVYAEELAECTDKLYVMTDDGSAGEKGFVTTKAKQLFDEGEHYDVVFVVGPMIMMKVTSELTREYGIHTIVSMNCIMLDGTGMCGGCRLTVGGQTKYACVDGPEFDGHLVDFNEALQRMGCYKTEESAYYTKYKSQKPVLTADGQVGHVCRLTGDIRSRHRAIEQAPEDRIHNFAEVSLGFDEELALAEASRCLGCKNATCKSGCPVSVQIPEFIAAVKAGDYDTAAAIIQADSNLPAICGRVCPQEAQCEKNCIRNSERMGGAVAIGNLERFVGDYALSHDRKRALAPSCGKRVAIIGSGPAGLTCAADLAMKGVEVTVFEAFHRAGGVLVYGIPEFRLPKAVVQREIENLTQLGVEIKLNTVIGKTLTMDELLSDYDAIFVGTGAGLPLFLGIHGEGLNGVCTANEYLTRVNLLKAYEAGAPTPLRTGLDVVVVGAGNVAMDAARTARRMGAKVTVVYRRTRAEMPARSEELHHAEEEGIQFSLLTNPIEILGDKAVSAIRCTKMELGEPDASGRRRPVAIADSDFDIPCDQVIVALGTSPNPLLKRSGAALQFSGRGTIVVNEQGQTSNDKVFAGGDAVTGAATVILAMGAGKRAAKSIAHRLGIE